MRESHTSIYISIEGSKSELKFSYNNQNPFYRVLHHGRNNIELPAEKRNNTQLRQKFLNYASLSQIPSLLVPHSEQNLDVALKYGEPHSSQNFAGMLG